MGEEAVPTSIEFVGPFSLWPDASGNWSLGQAECAGIYLFTVIVEGEHRILYVGEANNIAYRLRSHLKSYLAGEYLLYDEGKLLVGTLESRWNPSPDAERTLMHLDKHRQLLTDMLKHVSIFYAEVDAEKPVLHRIESALVKTLRKDTAANAFLENDRLSVSRDQDHVQIRVACKSKFFKVPSELNEV